MSQYDSQISARLAVSAGKDSTSMKIIALITAAYLPGAFVAVSSLVTGAYSEVPKSTVSPKFMLS